MNTPPPLRAAMVRFTTLDPTRWASVCKALAELGFDAIDLPLVWRDHERPSRPGQAGAPEFDFTSSARSVRAMCEAITGAGLRVVLRLGPLATDDAPGLGVPDRVLDDRRCQARTRRQNPVLVPDPPGMVALPSLASRAFREHSRAWVSAATRAVLAATERENIVRVILGPGPHALTRDDPFEHDHHPDGSDGLTGVLPPHEVHDPRALGAIERDVRIQCSYRDELADELAQAGLSSVPVFVSVPGSAAVSPAAHALAERYGLCVACPPSVAGAASIWRQVRHAVALGAAKGLHLEAWAGAPWYYPPTRGSHSVAATRVALAAGARDGTVRMGCAGGRWIGAVLAEDGSPRESTKRWRELLAWWGALPAGEEPGVELPVSAARVRAARAATAVHPAPLGLLGLLGLAPEELADPNAKLPTGDAGAEHPASEPGDALDQRLASYEQALWAVGVPCARVHAARDHALTPNENEEPEALASRGLEAFAKYAPVIDPPAAALVRLVRDGDGGEHLFVTSRSESAARVTPPGDGWEPAEPVTLDPGAVQVFTRARPDGAPAGADAARGAAGEG